MDHAPERSAQAHRRAELRAAADDQSMRTRALLIAAYRVAAEQQLSQPSATWLCAQAGVGRSTYYTHFATVDELAAEAITESFAAVSEADVAQRSGPHSGRSTITREGLTRLISGLEDARHLFAYASRVGSRARVIEHLIASTELFTQRTVIAEFENADAEMIRLVTAFVSAGTVHAILSWLDGPTELSREGLVAMLERLLPTELTTDRQHPPEVAPAPE